jgi:hypothetical protein
MDLPAPEARGSNPPRPATPTTEDTVTEPCETRALRRLRDGFLAAMQHTPAAVGPLALDPELVRTWLATASWGLGERPDPNPATLWIGGGEADRATDQVSEQLDRTLTVVGKFWALSASLSDVAWEVEHLDVLVESAVARLSEVDRFEEATLLKQELDCLKAEMWTALQRKPRPPR